MRISLRPHRLLLLAIALVMLGGALTASTLDAQEGAPLVAEPIVATYQGGELTLTGSGLGEPPSLRAVLFDYDARSQSVTSDSPLVEVWQDDLVRLSLPAGVESGQLRVFVDAVASEPVDLLVFAYDSFDIPRTVGTSDRPLAVAVGPDGTAWVNSEFHQALKSVSPGGAYRGIEIPQAAGDGIFAQAFLGDGRTRSSSLGEDIQLASDGSVWFSEGGGSLYSGAYFNTSRIVRYEPSSGDFYCFNVPADNAAVTGLLLDEERGLIWYSEGGLDDGNAISAITLTSSLSDCTFNPTADAPRDAYCSAETADDCHMRFELPTEAAWPAHLELDLDGNIWFTEFFGNRVGRLSPATGEIMELPLPPAIAQEFPGSAVGSGPWEISADSRGLLWVSEYFDATIVVVDPARVDADGCTELDALGRNPCVEEVFVTSDGNDWRTIHTVVNGADDLVWFGIEQQAENYANTKVGVAAFVAKQHNNTVVELPPIPDVTSISGMAQDSARGDVWFAQFSDRTLGRLRLVGHAGPADQPPPADVDSDGDGCTDAQELGLDPQLGGRRDPNNFWDFFDVPSVQGVRDGRIGLMGDILPIAARLGVTDGSGASPVNRYSDPLSPVPADTRAYHPAFDRSPPANGSDPWDSGPPDGTINMFDVLAVVMQYGHRC